ncbi:MAG: hypothetical protein ACREHD_25955, partial [Pirellulales bacterium]
ASVRCDAGPGCLREQPHAAKQSQMWKALNAAVITVAHAESTGAPAMVHFARSDSDDIPIEWIRWRPVGQLSRDEVGDLLFPPVAAGPGIYRFLIRDDTGVVAGYIGQAAKSLAKRFSLYRTRGRRPSYPLEKKTTSRNALRLIAELRAGRIVAVAVIDDRVICPDGRKLILDLSNAEFRASLERRLILQLCETGIEVLNRNSNPRWGTQL